MKLEIILLFIFVFHCQPFRRVGDDFHTIDLLFNVVLIVSVFYSKASVRRVQSIQAFRQRTVFLSKCVDAPQLGQAEKLDARSKVFWVEIGDIISFVRPDIWNFELLDKKISKSVRDSQYKIFSQVAVDAFWTEEISSLLG